MRSSELRRMEEDWWHKAECLGTTNDIFFSESPTLQRLAKQVCMHCEVRQECLDFAIKTDQKDGVWGGMTARERKREPSLRTA